MHSLFQAWLQIKLAWRHLIMGGHFFTLPALLSVMGMALGVASLIMAMGVFSGYQKTLKAAIRGVTGDLIVIKTGGHLQPSESLMTKIKSHAPGIVAASPFVQLEGIVAAHGTVSGALLQGIEQETAAQVTDLRSRLKEGVFELRDGDINTDGEATALVGIGVAQKLQLKLGDQLRFVLPVASKNHALGFAPRVLSLRVVGLVDLGKYEFNERFVVTSMSTAQKLAGYKTEVTGFRFRLQEPELAEQAQIAINQSMGYPMWARSWQQLNQNVMQAVALEKIVIFLVVCIIVVAASLNVAGHLYISILRKYSEVSIMRTMGARSSFISAVFTFHGLLVGLIGAVLGVLLGFVGVHFVEELVRRFDLLPAQVYRISQLSVVVSWIEVLWILLVSGLICYLTTLVPARRGGRLPIIEGIRHE